MTYFAAALVRAPADGWSGQELDLDIVDDLDGVADLVREAGAEEERASPGLLFVEEDDEWLGVVRVDGDADPRVFLSDGRVVETSDLAAKLYEEVPAPPVSDAAEEDDDEASVRPTAHPAGDVELLADLGTPAPTLLALCAEEGHLPADIITALCENAGCLDEMERLRGG